MSLYCGRLYVSLLFTSIVFLSLTVTSSQLAPFFLEEPSDIVVKKNRQALLKCRAGGLPSPRISWRHNGNDLNLAGDKRRKILPDGSLLFITIEHTKSSKPDEGNYQCVASSQVNNLDYEIRSRIVKLQVAGLSSKITIEPVTSQVIFGDVARLFCKVRHSLPDSIIQWKFKQKDGSEIALTPSSKVTLLPGGVIQIRNVQLDDGGEFKYTDESPVTKRTHSSSYATLTVIPDRGNPRRADFVVTPPSRVVAIKGKHTVLECAVKGSPKPAVKWYKNGQIVTYDSRVTIIGESNLEIMQVVPSDAGTYKCEATSSGSQPVSAETRLKVNYPPVFIKRLRDHNAYTGSVVTFNCTADGNPKPNVYWSKNGYKIGSTDFTKVGDGFLKVEDLLPSDMGMYQCFATNSLGSIQASAELSVYKTGVPLPTTRLPTTAQTPTTILPPTTTPTPPPTTTEPQRPPDPPRNVQARTISDSEIEVTWIPPKNTYGKVLSYNMFFTLSKGGIGIVKMTNVSGDTLRVKIDNLKPDTDYNFMVYARNKYGTGRISESATGRTAPIASVPKAPRSLVAVPLSSSSIKVQWNAPLEGSEEVAQYVLEYQEVGANVKKSQVIKQLMKTITFLKTYTEYKITVYGVSKAGLRGIAATTTVFTLGGIPKGPPTGLTLQAAQSGTALIVSWNPPHHSLANGRIIKYALEYRRSGKTMFNRVELGDVLDRTITRLQPNTKYEVRIAAGTSSGFGDFTDLVTGNTNITKCTETVPPGAPQNLRVTLPLKTERILHVQWQSPSNAGRVCVTDYVIRYGAGSPYPYKEVRPANVTSILLKELEAGKQYIVKVTARNKNHDNGPGVEESIFIPVSGDVEKPVKNVRVTPLSSTALRVTWTEMEDLRVQLYHVYRSLKKTVTYCGNTTLRELNCTRLQPYTYYTILVRRNGEKVNGTATNQTLEAKPSPPTDITLSSLDDNTTDLHANWQIPEKVNGKILRYKIYYSLYPDAPLRNWTMQLCDGATMQTRLKGLKPGTKYYFRMKVENGAGWSELSQAKMIVTPDQENDTNIAPTVVAQVGPAGLKDKTLWIIIAAVAGITLIAIIIISVVLCKKRSVDDIQMPRRPPPTYKSAIQSNGSAKKKKEEKPPDLWINHTENMEMKPSDSANPPPDVANVPKSTFETQPLIDNRMENQYERHSFAEPEIDPLPPPPEHMLSDDMPSPVSSPGPAPYHPVVTYPRPQTPESTGSKYPMTSTPMRHNSAQFPRSGSLDNSTEPLISSPPQRSQSYDLDHQQPIRPPIPTFQDNGPHYKVPQVTSSAPKDDIQLPPVGYNRPAMPRSPNGVRSPPPTYNEVYSPKQQRDAGEVVADLDKELAGLEGLMKDLNEITGNDYLS
uniref:Neogenin/DCC n=1 Tax=Nematostella vectensis TaxID=45351 RepID=A0A0A7LUI7_NEMVE|nr:neogenin/DCC [Nematostella vectensis]